MDYLQELWNLYEESKGIPKPPLQDPGEPSVEGPNRGYDDHPIIQNKKNVDSLRLDGVSATDAHEKVYGDVNLSDVDAKGRMSATLGRTQEDGNKKAVHVEKDAEHLSIFAKDEALQDDVSGVADMKTPKSKEVPTALQEPEGVGVDTKEEYDYNDDVAFINQYGRK